ncbi:MAG TPA: amidohydrolase family protein [Solirubrobacterales bacterium]
MPAATNEALVNAWLEPLLAEVPGASLFDAHTHIGFNDPDGARLSGEQLIEILAALDARGVVFPMHEPDGYREANDLILSDAADSEGRLVPFCRLNPNDDAVAEASRCIELGARGIKLHPRSDDFALDSPESREIFALAHQLRLPVLVHAGRGIPALGEHTLELSTEFPKAPIILAHAAVTDLSWIWRHLDAHPNVFIDTSWWVPTDLMILFSHVPPGRILFASDVPYGTPALNAILTLRCALQAGLGVEQIRAVCGAQLERLLAGDEPLDLGPSPGASQVPSDLLVERVSLYLMAGLARLIVGAPAEDVIGLARLACKVDDDAPQATAFQTIGALIDRQVQAFAEVTAEDLATPSTQRLSMLAPLLLGAALAATPSVPAPAEAPAAQSG